MRDIIMELLKVTIMILAFVITHYAIPWIKARTENDTIVAAIDWTMQAVLAAEQMHQSKTGPERKAIVTKFIKQILIARNISLSDEEIDILIESAVKQMNDVKAMRPE